MAPQLATVDVALNADLLENNVSDEEVHNIEGNVVVHLDRISAVNVLRDEGKYLMLFLAGQKIL